MDKVGALEALRTLTNLVQKEYQLSTDDIKDAIFSDTFPATIFTPDSTPLEAVISYFASKGMAANVIAKIVSRNTNYVNQILSRGKKHKEPETTPYRIPTSVLGEGSAGERITTYLAGIGLTTKHISQLLQKNESTTWTWRKRGEER